MWSVLRHRQRMVLGCGGAISLFSVLSFGPRPRRPLERPSVQPQRATAMPSRAEITVALGVADQRVASLRTQMAAAQAEVNVLRRALRKAIADEWGVEEVEDAAEVNADMPPGHEPPAADVGNNAGGGGDVPAAGVDNADDGGGGGARGVRRRWEADWPAHWVKTDYVRGGSVPQGACTGCWWQFQGYSGFRPHAKDKGSPCLRGRGR